MTTIERRARTIRHRMRTVGTCATLGVLALTGCSDDDGDGDAGAVRTETDTTEAEATEPDSTADTAGDTAAADADADFPTIVEASPSRNDDGTWNFSVTVSSPYDTPERYADGWRVIGPDGTVFGVHTLAHDHANEQPFTRRQSDVEIPDDVDEVTIEGRDLVNGFGGDTVTVSLDR